jgi:hypothetical protein
MLCLLDLVLVIFLNLNTHEETFTFIVFNICLFWKISGFNCAVLHPLDTNELVQLPWYGKNEYLDSIAEIWGLNGLILPNSNSSFEAEGGFDIVNQLWIPVKAWVHCNNDGNNCISEFESLLYKYWL